MDLFKLLKRDHEKVSGLFKKIADTSDGAVKTRQRLCSQIKAELELHAEVEEAHFYPALEERPETRDRVPEALEEHKQVKRMLAEIAQMEPGDAAFLKQIKALQKAVRHHVREEEREIFPAARKALGDERTREIAQKIEAMKKQHQRQAAE